MIIGLTGRIASGKSMVADLLKKKGFDYIAISMVVREEAARRGIEITRKNLQDLGNEIRKKEGAGAWTKRIVQIIKGKDYVVDGIRNPGEIAELRKLKDFVLVSVDAPGDIRCARVLQRAKPSDPTTKQGFLEMDKRDFGEVDPLGQQVGKCMEMADYHLVNDKTVGEFENRIAELFPRLAEAHKI